MTKFADRELSADLYWLYGWTDTGDWWIRGATGAGLTWVCVPRSHGVPGENSMPAYSADYLARKLIELSLESIQKETRDA